MPQFSRDGAADLTDYTETNRIAERSANETSHSKEGTEQTKSTAILQHESLEPVSAFKHKPLLHPRTQIRLLRLHPGQSEDEIRCTLQVYELNEAPPYHAISYTWGSSASRKIVFVNGDPLAVYANCHYCLWQVRIHKDPEALIWIDNISINQEDLLEKRYQVHRIGDIFARAQSTFACVGPSEDDSDFLFEQLRSLRQAVRTTEPVNYEICDLCNIISRDWVFESGHEVPHAIHTWLERTNILSLKRLNTAMILFDSRSYWRRVWIVPELAESKNVCMLCGLHTSDLRDMGLLNELFLRIGWSSPNSGTILNKTLHQPRKAETEDPSAIDQMQWALRTMTQFYFVTDIAHGRNLGPSWDRQIGEFECSDMRDRVFANTRLILWDPHFPVPPVNYEASVLDLATQALPHLRQNACQPYRLLKSLRWDGSVARKPFTRRKPRKSTRKAGSSTLVGDAGRADKHRLACKCCGVKSMSKTATWLCSRGTSELYLSAITSNPLLYHRDGGLAVMTSKKKDPKWRPLQWLNQSRAGFTLTCIRKDGAEEIVGRITGLARPGDLLAGLPIYATQGIHLVLRKNIYDTYGILGRAIVDPGTDIFDIFDESTTASSVHLDFHLDADDIIANTTLPVYHTFRYETLLPADLDQAIVSHFSRHRFSSFARPCKGHQPLDWAKQKHPHCVQCVLGDEGRVCVCVHCGMPWNDKVQRSQATLMEDEHAVDGKKALQDE